MGQLNKLNGPVFYKESSDAKEQLERLQAYHENAPIDLRKQIENDIRMLSYGIVGEDSGDAGRRDFWDFSLRD